MKKQGIDYLIHLERIFTEGNILLHDLHQKKEYPNLVQRMIDQEWKKVSLNKDIFIFNGPVSCLESYKLEGNKLKIYYYESDYKSYYGTNIRNASILAKADLANTLAVCTIVHTSDDMIIVGKRASHLAEGTCQWHIPGGTLEYFKDKVNHPFQVMRRELEEELNLTCIDKMLCLGLGENLTFKKPEFLLYTTTELTSTEIKENLHLACDYNEHSEIRFIPSKEIESFIRNNNFTEIGTAAISCYLRMKKELLNV